MSMERVHEKWKCIQTEATVRFVDVMNDLQVSIAQWANDGSVWNWAGSLAGSVSCAT